MRPPGALWPKPPDGSKLHLLTPFGVAFRYDDLGEEEEPTLDRAWAKECVDRTLAWAEDKVAALKRA